MLDYENNENPYSMRSFPIAGFMSEYAYIYVSSKNKKEIEENAVEIMKQGIKFKDACHVSCAIKANCDIFLTTDKSLLKYESSKIKMMNPVDYFK